jgi:fructose-1,6-bisphosphatase/inositol monophosphatase family enzyme
MPSSAEIDLLEEAVLHAAEVLIRRLESPEELTVRLKSDRSVVTNLDLELDEVLRGCLAGSHPLVSEEAPSTHELLSREAVLWVVDPLDGTSSCRRFRTARDSHVGFGPLVSLQKDRRVEACGFYHVPCRTLFTALRGGGVWKTKLESPTGVRPALAERERLKVRDGRSLKESVMLFYPGSSGELELVATCV